MKMPVTAIVCVLAALPPLRADDSQAKQQLVALENHWLQAEDDAEALDAILAPDFLHVLHKTAFTDVFAYREGKWRAVNAQESPMQK